MAVLSGAGDASLRLVYKDANGVTQTVGPAKPLPVDIGGATVNISGPVTVANEVEVKNDTGNPVPASVASLPLPTGAATAANQVTANTSLAAIAGLSIPAHDYIALGYTGTNLTSVVYRTGGAAGSIVGTLTLAYTGSQLISVTKS